MLNKNYFFVNDIVCLINSKKVGVITKINKKNNSAFICFDGVKKNKSYPESNNWYFFKEIKLYSDDFVKLVDDDKFCAKKQKEKPYNYKWIDIFTFNNFNSSCDLDYTTTANYTITTNYIYTNNSTNFSNLSFKIKK